MMNSFDPACVVKEVRGKYRISKHLTADELMVVAAYMGRKFADGRTALKSPVLVRRYLQAILQVEEREVFGVIYLDNQHCVIKNEELFFGTIDGASVYPREVVKAVLACNAAAVIFYHNHPSGLAEPSQADKRLTERLKEALDLVGVRVLDHMVYGLGEAVSFAERGLL
jgi:DNA repair protein RadC